MTELYDRRIRAVVGNREYTGFEIRFDINLSMGSDPNNGVIAMDNLSASDRKSIEDAGKDAQVVVYAGFASQGDPPAIFQGRWRRAVTERNGPALITTIEAASAYRARAYTRQLNKAYRKGTALNTVLRDLLDTLEIGDGNLQTVLNQVTLAGATGNKLLKPFAVSGPAWDSLEQILKSSGFRVTTEGDGLLVTGLNRGIDRTAVLLNDETGLIGQPSVDKDGVLSASSLIIPNLIPGRVVRLQSEFVSGDYVVRTAKYTGSLYGSEFKVDLEARVQS
jgi:hypothetical protein